MHWSGTAGLTHGDVLGDVYSGWVAGPDALMLEQRVWARVVCARRSEVEGMG